MAIYGIIIMNNTDEKIAESECRIKSEIWDATQSIYPPLNSVKQCMKCGDDITDSIFRFHMEYIAATDDTKEHILKKCSKCKGYWKEDVYRGDK